MPQLEPSPFDCGGSGLADSARSLVLSLAVAPDAETDQVAALRFGLIGALGLLAERWAAPLDAQDSSAGFNYHKALWKIRDIAVGLAMPAPTLNSGVSIALTAMSEQFLPNTRIEMRPSGLAAFVAREKLTGLQDALARIGAPPIETDAAVPEHLLLVRFPQGEQNNTLMACCLLPHFSGSGISHVFAASVGGPAYFFALAAEMQNYKGFSDAYDPPRLCFVGELLQISGWLEHPITGPLISRWRDHFGFDPDYLDRKILSKSTLTKMRETQETYRAMPPAYTPLDFDRATPRIWDAIRGNVHAATTADMAAAPHLKSNVIDILNAGWSFAQTNMPDFYRSLNCANREDRYHARRTLNSRLAELIQSQYAPAA